MIKVIKNKELNTSKGIYSTICVSCGTSENINLLEITTGNNTFGIGTAHSICTNCLKELKKELENIDKE